MTNGPWFQAEQDKMHFVGGARLELRHQVQAELPGFGRFGMYQQAAAADIGG